MNNSRLLLLKAEKNRRTKKTGWFVLHRPYNRENQVKSKNESFKGIE